MKIALAQFEINKVGGITTYVTNLKKGLKNLGHETTDIYLKSVSKTIKQEKGYDMTLGYNTPFFVTEAIAYLNQFDLIIFTSGCPHKIKGITPEWKRLYSETKPKKLTVLHDMYYEKLYPWLKDVVKYTKILSLQEKTTFALKNLNCDKTMIPLPISLEEAGLYEKEKKNLAIDNNHFKSCKHKEVFVKAIPLLDKKIICENYGRRCELICCIMINGTNPMYVDKDGITYWKKAEEAGMKFKGELSNNDMRERMKSCKVHIDMSRFENVTNIDYTILEAMKYGAVPITNCKLPDIFEEGKNYLQINETDSEGSLAILINDVIHNWDKYKEMREANLKLISKMDITKNAKEVIDYSMEELKIPKTGLEEWM